MLKADVECQILACLVRIIWVRDQHAQAHIGSCMLRLRLGFRGSGGQPLPPALKLSLSLSMHDPMLSLSPSLSMHELSLSMPEPMLSLSMRILATYPVAALDVTIRTQNQN